MQFAAQSFGGIKFLFRSRDLFLGVRLQACISFISREDEKNPSYNLCAHVIFLHPQAFELIMQPPTLLVIFIIACAAVALMRKCRCQRAFPKTISDVLT